MNGWADAGDGGIPEIETETSLVGAPHFVGCLLAVRYTENGIAVLTGDCGSANVLTRTCHSARKCNILKSPQRHLCFQLLWALLYVYLTKEKGFEGLPQSEGQERLYYIILYYIILYYIILYYSILCHLMSC